MKRRAIQVAEELAHHAGVYLQRESNRTSLITVTRADVSPDLKNATIYVSVLPHEEEERAIAFVKRQRGLFREYLKSHSKLKFLPFIDFVIDEGEKNRQRVDDLTRT
ncbi:hypothetical protein COU20_03250 [Candidatus Kaiserbacteria bacterium CG10_big_fil_rev_8_21_14_0_10_59_10]|uniref:Ribosome-binding factor A n=1 Tax=Candidatus Kaiserbacteria bacterium CG10_big_fil_rev_8_21_14_0_10_59_10 TaxID=1974612 RepID=A0A2H0U6V4_9BACT|nr:MAG: hypothetical protein COU20_03250 [Candidatus Kaiserbacteria bacterium CG10_big_fil_rev_8_21_14_0_10_59_10]